MAIAALAGGVGLMALARKRSAGPGFTVGKAATLPPSVTGTPQQHRVTASTGRAYMVTTWAMPGANRAFVLAVLAADPKYFVSYWSQMGPVERRDVWQVNAPTLAEQAALAADFKLRAQ